MVNQLPFDQQRGSAIWYGRKARQGYGAYHRTNQRIKFE